MGEVAIGQQCCFQGNLLGLLMRRDPTGQTSQVPHKKVILCGLKNTSGRLGQILQHRKCMGDETRGAHMRSHGGDCILSTSTG